MMPNNTSISLELLYTVDAPAPFLRHSRPATPLGEARDWPGSSREILKVGGERRGRGKILVISTYTLAPNKTIKYKRNDQ
jgi:hypothetical protein